MSKSGRFDIVFFDVGNIFISDDPAALFIYRRLYDWLAGGKRYSPGEYFRLRAEHIRNGGDLWTFIRAMIPDGIFSQWRMETRRALFANWRAYSPEIPGMADAVRRMAPHYRMGLIANQPRDARGVLDEYGLLSLFDIAAISGELKLDKPHPGIFRWALEKAGVPAERALMIGDRIDNDIRPAKALGMKTLWLRLNFDQRGWKPSDEFERCYVESLSDASVSDKEPESSEETPDYTAMSPERLVGMLID
ncbi:MAG: HAD family hydrolase [bacterium]|nr:HAD family hydrolase [Candidatus Sumerlaeota bacterium]